MSIARSRSPFIHLYSLCSQVLSSVPEDRYFGIMVTDDLSWSSHVQSIYSKPNSTLGFLHRNLWRCLAKLKESAYISLVRSTLEYAASVWDPHLAKDINKLENIHRRSARFVTGNYCTTSSVTQMLQQLGWQDFQSLRRDLRLPLLYKVVTGHVDIQPEHVGLVAADDRTGVEHQFKFRAVGSSTQAFCHSFAVRTVGNWNSLLSHVMKQSTPASFKVELSRLTSATYAPGNYLQHGCHLEIGQKWLRLTV